MHTPIISLIVAIGKNRELGKNNKLLWHIPEDMAYFRTTIKNHAVIMGRKTFESVLSYTNKPLDCLKTIVVTRDTSYSVNYKNVIICHSLDEALEKAKTIENDELFIAGGSEIYKQALYDADRLYVTLVDREFPEADVFFPDYSKFIKVVSRKESSNNSYHYTFLVLEK